MTEDFSRRFAAARRQIIEKEYANLNPEQREAVLTTEGPLLLLAGAGSGKTTVLIHRVANILQFGRGADTRELPPDADETMLAALEDAAAGRTDVTDNIRRLCAVDPAAPWQVLAITFTNKAADELKNRLEAKLGEIGRDVWALTFHGTCVRILRRCADRIGFPNSFTIYDQADSLSVMKRILRDMNMDDKVFPPKAMLAAAGRYKGSLVSPEEAVAAEERSGDIRRIRTAKIYAAYAKHLQDAGAMDFDDLIYYTVRLLQDEPDVLAYYQKKFRYVLIDEYQDTNHLQYLFAALMASGSRNICVVGDDDQSIYKFRGATIENILSFESQYKKCRTIRLEQNYRSTGHILDAANAVIRNNQGRKGKELWTNKDDGNKIKLYVADNEHEEAQYVASQIMADYGRGENWRDHAVLYRMNAQSNQLEYAFKRAGVPYRIIGGTRFFDRAEVKDVLAYMNVIAVPEDELRLNRIINSPPRGIGERSMEIAREIAAREGTATFAVLEHADKYPELSRPALRMRQFASMINGLRDFASKNSPDALLDELLDKTGYLRALEEKHTIEDTARAENVREIKTSIISYMKESGDQTLAGFLADVALYTDLDNYDKDADSVVMMTMHSAKGLEFPTVFIVGMEEGIFPGMKAIGEPEEMEEERRLCYVAITRAMRQLHIVCARQRMLFGRTTANKVSRFVDEIPEEHIEKRNAQRPSHNAERRPEMQFASKSRYASARQYSMNAPAHRPAPPSAPSAQAKPAPDYSAGDRIVHQAFGAGTLTKMTPMGGDFLIEISFDSGSTKKLMLRAAAPHMKKA